MRRPSDTAALGVAGERTGAKLGERGAWKTASGTGSVPPLRRATLDMEISVEHYQVQVGAFATTALLPFLAFGHY